MACYQTQRHPGPPHAALYPDRPASKTSCSSRNATVMKQDGKSSAGQHICAHARVKFVFLLGALYRARPPWTWPAGGSTSFAGGRGLSRRPVPAPLGHLSQLLCNRERESERRDRKCGGEKCVSNATDGDPLKRVFNKSDPNPPHTPMVMTRCGRHQRVTIGRVWVGGLHPPPIRSCRVACMRICLPICTYIHTDIHTPYQIRSSSASLPLLRP